MFDHFPDFQSPFYLIVAAVLLPLLWWWSYRRLGVLGRGRRLTALILRTFVLLLLLLAAAQMLWVQTSDRLTVIYLLDQSKSIPESQRKAMIDYVNQSILEHRENEDRVGVVVFGKDAAIEVPPFDDDVQIPSALESLIDPDHTNLAGAMKLALASFPEDAAKRIVVVSDGNENLGDSLEQARGLVGSGVSIDVVPIYYTARSEVLIERLTMPSDVRKGQPFELRAVLVNTTPREAGAAGTIPGKVVFSQLVGGRTVFLGEKKVNLPPGKTVVTLRQEIDQPAFYQYTAVFIPDRPADDGMPENNRASGFCYVRGKGRVLLIEDDDAKNRGLFDFLVQRLRKQNLEVDVQPTDQLFTGLGELQPYDTVILANVPRERFTEDQIDMLVSNTHEMGAGLVMLGGNNSFGAGGWNNTKLEEAMPIDFQIESAKVVPRGALAMIMHASEMAQGNHWQKVIAVEALKTLGPRDYCGVLHWQMNDQWLWGKGFLEVGPNRKKMLSLLSRMSPGDMPTFGPAMQMAARGFANLPDAAVKHMIIISDGDPTQPPPNVIKTLVNLKVTVTTVAVGCHGTVGHQTLRNIAAATGGKYHVAKNPKALPRIFQEEARKIAQPVIYENKDGVPPEIRFPHEMLSGVGENLPDITGFVMTTVKENPLVEIALVSPKPTNEKHSTILASWPYGQGRAVALTTDAGARWANSWTQWENYDKFFSQIVRWSMRPTGQEGKFNVTTRVENGSVKVIISALDKDDAFLNFLNVTGQAVGPDMKPIDIKIRQMAPGRYEGEFPATQAGSHFLVINPGQGQAAIRTGVNVPCSSEFHDRASNDTPLRRMAALAPKDSPPGEVITATDPVDTRNELKQWLQVNTFRHDLPKATSSQETWPWLVFLASCFLFFDVFFRRVQVNFAGAFTACGRVIGRLFGREPEPEQPEFMQRLRSRKAEVSGQLDRIRADARFEAPTDTSSGPSDLGSVEELSGPGAATRPAAAKPSIAPGKPAEEEKESYTERLLRAKKKVWDDKNNPKE
ncbi:MAG: VWA domain-containing protein [Pirellulales bacterium]|nr:VWA domain-containing protein [Pirellulales bacterium]